MDDMKWETLSSEYLSNHIYFTARRDVCQRPDGAVIDPYFVVELPTAATAFALTVDERVLMVRQYRYPIAEVLLETPGGFVDPGESFEEGMKRELLEETGYAFSHVEYLGKLAANPGVLNNYTEMFLATGGMVKGRQHLDHNEQIELVSFSIDEIIQMVKENKIVQSVHANCIMLALLKLGRMKFI